MFTQVQLNAYVRTIREQKLLDIELRRLQEVMIVVTRGRIPNRMPQLTQMFKALLAEKARQETVYEMSNDYRRYTENTSTRPAHDPRASVGIWDVLKQKVTGCGQ